MANECRYDMRVIAKYEKALERFEQILRYQDKEFFIYRVMGVNAYDECDLDGFKVKYFDGCVAWSPSPWVNDKPDPNEKSEKTGASYTNLQEICKALNIAVEVWAEEECCGFQEHIVVNNKGEVLDHSSEDWCFKYNDNDELIGEEGGFEEFGDWRIINEIFKD